MSDAEWAVPEPLLPHPAWLAGKGGRPSRYCMRDAVDGIAQPDAQRAGVAGAPSRLPARLDRLLLGG
jgi:hypothetical protein